MFYFENGKKKLCMESKKREIGKFISHTKAIITWSTAVAISIWIAALIVVVWSHWTSTKTLLIIATKTFITAPVITSTTLISWITLITLRWIWIIISRPILIPSLTSTFLFSITQYNKINHFNVSWAFDFFLLSNIDSNNRIFLQSITFTFYAEKRYWNRDRNIE